MGRFASISPLLRFVERGAALLAETHDKTVYDSYAIHSTAHIDVTRYAGLLPGLVCLFWGCGDKVNDAMSAFEDLAIRSSLPETPFADSTLGIGNASGVAVHPDGRVFVTSLNGKDDLHFFGQVLILEDEDGDGFADKSTLFADSLTTVTGVAFRGDEVYVAVYGEVVVMRDEDGDGRADVKETVIRLPPWGTHVNNQITFGPDGMLYIPFGSEFNRDEEALPHRASIFRVDPDARDINLRTEWLDIPTFARGIRNAYDLAFAPPGHVAEGELFATDNGPMARRLTPIWRNSIESKSIRPMYLKSSTTSGRIFTTGIPSTTAVCLPVAIRWARLQNSSITAVRKDWHSIRAVLFPGPRASSSSLSITMRKYSPSVFSRTERPSDPRFTSSSSSRVLEAKSLSMASATNPASMSIHWMSPLAPTAASTSPPLA